ncbi:UNVERIFIED_CONTAM: hypothetical protein GTU68_031900, partial [Idotea baltica]|nr:hypothetical protein [Idotea baltica]
MLRHIVSSVAHRSAPVHSRLCSPFLSYTHGGPSRDESTLVIVEHDNVKLTPITLNAVTAATKLGGDVTCLVAGKGCDSVVKEVSSIKGVKKVLFCDNAVFEGFLSESVTPLVLKVHEQHKFSHILAGASAFGKNLIPRIAVKLDVSPISDITGIKSADTFVRTVYAGNAIQTVKSKDSVKCITSRGTSFEPAEASGGSAQAEE